MNRRTALKKSLILLGGTIAFSNCIDTKKTLYNNFSLYNKDIELLAEFSETLLPATDTPGAKQLKLHLFILTMVDDCHSPDEQREFCDGLRSFEEWAEQELGKSFVNADKEKKADLLDKINQADTNNIKRFYAIAKKRLIQGYLNSKYVMTSLIKYELVPPPYAGDVTLS